MLKFKEYKIDPDVYPKDIIRVSVITSVVALILGALAILFLPYLDAIQGEVKIFTDGIPSVVAPTIDGNLVQFKEDNAAVVRDDIIGLVDWDATPEKLRYYELVVQHANLGTFDDYRYLLTKIKSKEFPVVDLLDDQLYSLRSGLQNYINLVLESPLKDVIYAYDDESSNISEALTDLNELNDLQNERGDLAVENFERDSLLTVDGVISEREYVNARSTLLTEKISQAEYEHLRNLEYQKIKSLTTTTKQLSYEHYLKLIANKEAVITELISFRKLYHEKFFNNKIVTPINGVLRRNQELLFEKFCTSAEPVASIYPDEYANDNFIDGYVSISSYKLGQVKEGMDIKIELNEFPNNNFGMVETKIDKIEQSNISNEHLVWFKIKAPIVTSYNIELEQLSFRELTGFGKIVINKQPLFAYIMSEIRSSYDKII